MKESKKRFKFDGRSGSYYDGVSKSTIHFEVSLAKNYALYPDGIELYFVKTGDSMGHRDTLDASTTHRHNGRTWVLRDEKITINECIKELLL